MANVFPYLLLTLFPYSLSLPPPAPRSNYNQESSSLAKSKMAAVLLRCELHRIERGCA